MSIIATLGALVLAANANLLPQVPDTTPPAEMKTIEFLLGDWAGKEKYHMMGQVSETTAKVSFKKTLLGRYFQMIHKANMAGFGDTEGMMLITFDTEKKKFQAWWFDSLGPGALDSEGSLNGDTLQFVSKPTMMMGSMVTYRSTFVKKSAKQLTFLLEMKETGEWSKFIEGTYDKK